MAAFSDADGERKRLAAQAELIARWELEPYRRAGFLDCENVLDVGGGTGAPARVLRERGVRVLTVDRDPVALAHCEGPCAVVHAGALPFADRTFPGVYSRLMLQHVVEPEQVVKELVRVAAAGGVVLLVDTDLASFRTEPSPNLTTEAREAWIAHALARGARPDAGLHLRRWLVGAGARNVHVEALTITSDDLGRASFARLLLAPHLAALGTASVREKGVAELFAWSKDPNAFGAATLYVASGRAPRNEP